MKFTVEKLNELDIMYDPVSDVIVAHTRWSVIHQIVFQYEGKHYRTEYEVGATENQDTPPFGYEDEIECTEVEFKKVMVGQWVPLKNHTK